MAIEFNWPAAVSDSVCLAQPVVADTPLDLNGQYSLVLKDNVKAVNFNYFGFSRNITITVKSSISIGLPFNFTIIGSQNGITVSEVLLCIPTSALTTVNSVNNYDIITSITCDRGIMDPGYCTVGTGLTGFFVLLPVGESIKSIGRNNFALSFSTETNNGCNYTIYEALGETINFPFSQLISDQLIFPVGTNPYVGISQIIQFNDVCQYLIVQVTSPNDNATLRMQYLAI